MTRRQLAVPMVAALLGGAVTAAGMLAGSSGNGAVGRQQGLLALDSGERFSAAELYERAAPSVVSISARTVQPGAAAFQADAGGELGVSTGSGFVLDEDGRIVTNAHVVSGVTAVQVTFPDGQIVAGGGDRQGRGDRPRGAARRARPARPAPARARRLRRPCGRATAWSPSATRPACRRPPGPAASPAPERRIEVPGGYVIDGLLETDAVIEPATSGGPLLGADGRVVGITSRLGDDTSYAVPADVARDVLAELEERHKVIRPWLGLRGRAAPGGLAVIDVERRRAGRARRAAAPATSCSRSTASRFARFAELLDEVDGRDSPSATPSSSHVLRCAARAAGERSTGPALEERPATRSPRAESAAAL